MYLIKNGYLYQCCLILSFFLLFSTAHSQYSKDISADSYLNFKVKDYHIPSYSVFAGEVLKLKLPVWENISVKKLRCRDKDIPFYLEDSSLLAYIPESYFSDFSAYKCEYLLEDGRSVVMAKVNVKKKKYPTEYLKVVKKRVWPSKSDQQRIKKEQQILNRIYMNYTSYPLFQKAFKLPLGSYITSDYGKRRVFNQHKKSQHLGIDFRAAVGTPIPSSNRGRVVFTGDLFYTGKTVIIDHGLGIFTVYAHLSSISVGEGELVGAQEILGLGGMTGRVTGPHLHWGVKINGEWISGHSLVKVTI